MAGNDAARDRFDNLFETEIFFDHLAHTFHEFGLRAAVRDKTSGIVVRGILRDQIFDVIFQTSRHIADIFLFRVKFSVLNVDIGMDIEHFRPEKGETRTASALEKIQKRIGNKGSI